MAIYSIRFQLGTKHYSFTKADSTYPTKEAYEKGDYNELAIINNVCVLISAYMDMCRLTGEPHNVSYEINFE